MGFLLILVISVTANAVNIRHWAHEEAQKPIPAPPPFPEGRSLQDFRDDDYKSLRIHIEYGDLDLSSSNKDLLKDKIIHGTTKWYENVLKIRRLNQNLIMGVDTCYGVSVPSDHQTFGVEADVIIYVTAGKGEIENTIGWAVVCALTPDGYPAAGHLHLEEIAFQGSTSFEDQLVTSIHEVGHILAFNPSLYEYFQNQPVYASDVARGKSVVEIVTPSVVAKAKSLFGCNNMNGLELESSGGGGSAGAHWEKRLMRNDFMVADNDIQDVIYSDITLALFEDSGWYQVDYDYTTGNIWGKNEGCDFIEDKCVQNGIPAFPEFCNDGNNVERCDFMHLHKGYCSLIYQDGIPSSYQYFSDPTLGGYDTFLDYCPSVMQYQGGNCRGHDYFATKMDNDLYAEEACEDCRCVEGNFVKSGAQFDHTACLKVLKCHDDRVDLDLDGSTVTCPFIGGNVEIPKYEGVIYCPASNVLCAAMPCMNHCSGVGVCENGVCKCENGSSDPDCGGGDLGDDFSSLVLALSIVLVI